jgi:hypothetical protein
MKLPVCDNHTLGFRYGASYHFYWLTWYVEFVGLLFFSAGLPLLDSGGDSEGVWGRVSLPPSDAISTNLRVAAAALAAVLSY